jgi:hypothetical protein
MDEQQRNDQLLASAVKFLIDGGEEKVATVLLSCTLAYEETRYWDEEDIPYIQKYIEKGEEPPGGHLERIITLTAPRATYDVLSPINNRHYYTAEFRAEFSCDFQDNFGIGDSITNAFYALLNGKIRFRIKAMMININDQWRHELLALLRGDHVTNQGLLFSPKTPVVTWKNLRFRSQTEIRIAEALERAQVLFLPNCMARVGFSQRQNREADFLVCHKGKWGILEVDSPSSHPPTRTVEDHERDRLFKVHGIRVVEHFDASECWENADGVVKRFLYLLGQ